MFEFDGGRAVFFAHLEQIAPAPDVVPITIQIFAIGLAILLTELCLMLLDPVELGHRIDPDGIELHPCRRGDADPAGGRMDAQVDVLDLLEHHINGNAADLDLPNIHAAGRRSYKCARLHAHPSKHRTLPS